MAGGIKLKLDRASSLGADTTIVIIIIIIITHYQVKSHDQNCADSRLSRVSGHHCDN